MKNKGDNVNFIDLQQRISNRCQLNQLNQHLPSTNKRKASCRLQQVKKTLLADDFDESGPAFSQISFTQTDANT